MATKIHTEVEEIDSRTFYNGECWKQYAVIENGVTVAQVTYESSSVTRPVACLTCGGRGKDVSCRHEVAVENEIQRGAESAFERSLQQ